MRSPSPRLLCFVSATDSGVTAAICSAKRMRRAHLVAQSPRIVCVKRATMAQTAVHVPFAPQGPIAREVQPSQHALRTRSLRPVARELVLANAKLGSRVIMDNVHVVQGVPTAQVVRRSRCVPRTRPQTRAATAAMTAHAWPDTSSPIRTQRRSQHAFSVTQTRIVKVVLGDIPIFLPCHSFSCLHHIKSWFYSATHICIITVKAAALPTR